MKISNNRDIAVVIPARNEAERIDACLAALAGQCADRVSIILVVNNTTDDTIGNARVIADQHGLDLGVIDCLLPLNQGVGTARQLGCDHALRVMSELQYVLTTDADCIVAHDWIHRNVAHLQQVDAVCGKIDLIENEAGILDGMDRVLATNEGKYRKLVQQFYAQHAKGCDDIAGTHGEAAGASLAFRIKAYRTVGGFDPIKCGEDRCIVRALRLSGHSVRHADDVVVRASCRLTGRATGGMSDALKARITGIEYLIDDCLPAATWLVRNAAANTLGVWPPLVPLADRVHVRDLPLNIDRLSYFQSLRRPAIAAALPALAKAVSSSYDGTLFPDRGSAIFPVDPSLPQSMPRKAAALAQTQTVPSALAGIERNVK